MDTYKLKILCTYILKYNSDPGEEFRTTVMGMYLGLIPHKGEKVNPIMNNKPRLCKWIGFIHYLHLLHNQPPCGG